MIMVSQSIRDTGAVFGGFIIMCASEGGLEGPLVVRSDEHRANVLRARKRSSERIAIAFVRRTKTVVVSFYGILVGWEQSLQ